MAIALVANTIAVDALGAGSATTPGINTTGSSLLVAFLTGKSSNPTITDSKGNSWALVTFITGGNIRTRMYICSSPTVGSGHTFTATATGASICVETFSGTLSGGAADQTSTIGDPSSPFAQPGPITPSADNCVVVTGFGYLIGTTPFDVATIDDANFTITDQDTGNSLDTYVQIAMAYSIQTTATEVNPTWTTPDSDAGEVASIIISFKPAAAAVASSGFFALM